MPDSSNPADPSPPQGQAAAPAPLRLWTAIEGRFAGATRAAARSSAVDALLAVPGWRLADAAVSGAEGWRLRFDRAEGAGWVELRGSGDVRLAPGLEPEIRQEIIGWSGPLTARLGTLPGAAAGAMPDEEADLLAALAPVLSPADVLPGGWRWGDLTRRPDEVGGWQLAFSHPDGGAHHVIVPAADPTRIEDYPAGTSSASGVTEPATVTLRALVQLAVGVAGFQAKEVGRAPHVEVAGRAELDGDEVQVEGLSAADLERFHRDGYLVVPGVVAPALVEAVGAAIRWFLSRDPTWDGGWFYEIVPYLDTPGFQRSGTFLELYQHQALWDVRQAPRVHRVFADLWGRDDLWVSVDRVNLKPPVAEAPVDEWRDPGFVHWDVDTSVLPLPFGVQGLVALTDAGPEHGTFHCAPGFHRKLEEYAAAAGPGRDPRRPDASVAVVPIPVRAGDLLVWHHALPHGNGENRSAEVRVAQYVAMHPARFDNEHERLQRVRSWRERLPGGAHFEGDPLERERRLGETARLTTLGRRLLGLERWPA